MWFMGLSALLHVILLLICFSSVAEILRFKPKEPPVKVMRVVLAPKPKVKPQSQKKAFLDSAQALKSDKAPENARFESDANTRAASKEKGAGAEDLPQQKGREIAALELRDSTFSPTQKSQPTAPQPKQEPQPATQPTPPQTQQQKQELDKKMLKQESTLALAPKEKPSEKKPPTPPAPPKPKQSPQTEARPPPSVLTMDRRRTTISGGAQLGEDSSVASQESILGRYKTKLYRAVGSRWYLYVQNRLTLLNVGQVKIRFYIRANGVIEKTEFSEGDPNSTLGVISRRAISDVGALEPFPEELKQQLGEGYWEEITFSIY